jgi:hypothetical protein
VNVAAGIVGVEQLLGVQLLLWVLLLLLWVQLLAVLLGPLGKETELQTARPSIKSQRASNSESS